MGLAIGELLEQARQAGIQVVVDDDHITEVRGMWWMQGLMNAIWAREHEVVAVLSTGRDILTEVARLVDGMASFLN